MRLANFAVYRRAQSLIFNMLRGLRRTSSKSARFKLILKGRGWFFLALGIGAYLLNIPPPEGLSPEAYSVLVMSVVATILFVTEPIPLPAVALLIIVGQVLLLGANSNDVAKSIMSDSVLFIMGSLMLAVAIVKQKTLMALF